MQELKGITGIKEVLEKVLEDENKARELCLNLLQIIPKTKEEMEKEIGNVIDFPDLNLTLLLDFPHKIVVAISPNVTVSIKRKYSDENWWLGPKTFKGFIKELQTLHALPQNIQNEKVEEIRMKIDEKYKEWHTKLSKTDEVESSQEKEPELTQKENEVLRQLENGKLLPVTILRKTLDKKIVGEEINKQVLFFAALSAKLKNFRERLHCRLTGPSAAGKTYLITRVLDCFPPSMKIEVGGMTPKAWVYAAARTGFMDFHGKILVCLVEPPREFYDLINSVLTGDKEKFKWLYTNKIEGALTTSEIIIFGVPSYITASVKLPQEELATRILQLSPDLTREQTDRIMRSQSEEEYEVDEEDCNHEKILQEYIENIPICDVVVPFCDVVRGVFPKEVRMRRDFPKLKTLVKSITLFNYYLRPKIVIGDSVIVLSTLSDFALGLYLFSQAFEATFSGIPNYLQSFLSRLNEQFSSNSFSTAEAIQVFRDFSPNTVRAYLRQLEELNFLESSTVAGQKYYTILVSRGSNIIIDGFSFSKVKDVREKLLRKLNGAEVEYFGKKISPATIIEKLYGDEAIKKFIKRWEKLNKPKEQVCIETLATFLEKDMQIPTTLQPQTTRGGDEWL
jgi:DNA-binding CsgD family transcriptional regulator